MPTAAEEEGAVDEDAARNAAAAVALAPPGVAPRYVVWRIKPGTGAGAVAPRLERALRDHLEARMAKEMLSKAAQTGIILIRPELANCDANLPCALEVAEALNIRFVIGGEAVSTTTTTVTGWVIDKERAAEVRRATVTLAGPGKDAEAAAAQKLGDLLMATPAMEKVTRQQEAADEAQAQNTQQAERRRAIRRGLGGVLVAAGGSVGLLAAAAATSGGVLMGTGAGLVGVRNQFHTRASLLGMSGALVLGGSSLAMAVLLAASAVPLAGLGALAFVGVP